MTALPPVVLRLANQGPVDVSDAEELSFMATHEYSDQKVLVSIVFNKQGINRRDVSRCEAGEVDVITMVVDEARRKSIVEQVLRSPRFTL